VFTIFKTLNSEASLFRLQDQRAIKQTPRTYPNSVFDNPHMDGS
jgi:hypothetical protein